jgi:hypothetical protein
MAVTVFLSVIIPDVRRVKLFSTFDKIWWNSSICCSKEIVKISKIIENRYKCMHTLQQGKQFYSSYIRNYNR